MEKREYRFCVKITCLLLLALPVFFLVCGFLVPPQYEQTFLGALKDKCRALEETEGQRIILVGGSSVAFGVDSALIEAQIEGYTVVNFGMYAGLGTTVMLDLSKDDLRSGDIVILSPEQQAQTLSDYFNATAVWQAADGAFGMLGKISGENRGALLGQFPYFASDKLRYAVSGSMLDPAGVYRRDSFLENGDIDPSVCPSNIMPGGYDANMPIRFDAKMIDASFVERVNGYVRAAEEKGAAVWYRFPPMNALAVEDGADMDAYYDALDALLMCEIIGNPHGSVLDAGWFYDTNFHLNASGKTVNTYRMIRDIKAMRFDDSATDVALPLMPALSYAAESTDEGAADSTGAGLSGGTDAGTDGSAAGENKDAAYFIYEKNEDSWTVAGLTAEGAERKQLFVPASYEGLPVTAIGEHAFSENTAVTDIFVPEQIRFISDRAFAGCESLARIVMESHMPEHCLVGQALLEGTKAFIVVDEGAAADYKVNYFWSLYADRIMGKALPDTPFMEQFTTGSAGG